MYEKGSSIKVAVEIGGSGVKELEFIGKVVIDAVDFMAVPMCGVRGCEEHSRLRITQSLPRLVCERCR